jgi:hypothetical protein
MDFIVDRIYESSYGFRYHILDNTEHGIQWQKTNDYFDPEWTTHEIWNKWALSVRLMLTKLTLAEARDMDTP